MTSNPVASRMVGRAAELQVLLDAFHAGERGEARAVIIRGEAGIGKTRLISEFIAAVTGNNNDELPVVVATGQCVDLGPIGAPFTSIRRMLHELHTGVGDDAFRAAAGGTATLATMATLVPELVSDMPATSAGDAAYVAEAIDRVFEELSRDAHLVLVLEDLHWADSATLALLKTLAATLRGAHLTLIATYRSDDVGRGHALRPVLAELERSRDVEFLSVARMGFEGVNELSQELGGGTLTADQVGTILARSEGVPFFVEELVCCRDQPLPATLRDVVLARYERLSDATRRALGFAAVIGVQIDDALLQVVWGADPDDLTGALREAVGDGILIADGDGYTFRHALTREAVYDDLLPRERAAAHRAIAGALQERVDGGDMSHAGAAAQHWLAVHDVDRAFDATVVARARARADLAPETAASLGERLLELWPRVEDAESRVAATLIGLASQISQDYLDAGRYQSALRVAESMLDSAPDADDLDQARLHLAAMTAFRSDKRTTAHAHIDAMEKLLHGREDREARIMLARTRIELAWVAATDEQRKGFINEAFDLAQGVDDVNLLVLLLRRRARAVLQGGDYESSLTDIRRALELAPDGSQTRLNCVIDLQDTLMIGRRFSEAVEVGFDGVEYAARTGLERSDAALLYFNHSESLSAVGRADEALAFARRAAQVGHGASSFAFAAGKYQEALLHIWADNLQEHLLTLRSLAPTLAALADSPEVTIHIQALALDVAAARSHDASPAGRVAPLSEALAEATSLFSGEIESQADTIRTALVSVTRAQALLARLGETPDQRIAERVGELVGVLASDATSGPYVLVIEAFGREAAGSAGALEPWRAVVDLLETEPMPVRIGHEARYRLALALADAGERTEAIELLKRVVDEAPPHGEGLVARWSRDALARLGAGATPASGTLEALTAREREVLALVAEGLTNKEIGARLFMSPKTASVHVSAILAKLGASNRAEAASLYASRLERK